MNLHVKINIKSINYLFNNNRYVREAFSQVLDNNNLKSVEHDY